MDEVGNLCDCDLVENWGFFTRRWNSRSCVFGKSDCLSECPIEGSGLHNLKASFMKKWTLLVWNVQFQTFGAETFQTFLSFYFLQVFTANRKFGILERVASLKKTGITTDSRHISEVPFQMLHLLRRDRSSYLTAVITSWWHHHMGCWFWFLARPSGPHHAFVDSMKVTFLAPRVKILLPNIEFYQKRPVCRGLRSWKKT